MDPAAEKKSHQVPTCDRIPTLDDLKMSQNEDRDKSIPKIKIDNEKYVYRHIYRNELPRKLKKEYSLYNYCVISVCLSFTLGFIIGILLMRSSRIEIERLRAPNNTRSYSNHMTRSLNSFKESKKDLAAELAKGKGRFSSVTFVGNDKYKKDNKDIYPKGLTEDMKDILKDYKDSKHPVNLLNKSEYSVSDDTVLYNNVYWGPEVENAMPQGYGLNSAELWERYVNQSEIVSMENGCGRMQNRLVTFKDGLQACVRYRQNTDQIQGEIFSFYVAKLLNLTNLAPSVVKIVDVKDKLWESVANDIATAQWNSNRAVVLTQYIPSLEQAKIPDIFKPSNRHLNKNDVLSISIKENESTDNSKQILLNKLKSKNIKAKKEVRENFDHIDMKLNKKTTDLFVELAQWSDLIIFDYLTANLDRIVNNLFNFQWNVNIMNGPAHNLARKMDSGLLIFLDNESGLLHGYRLLKKYNVYHSVMLENLCVFRRRTIDSLKNLYSANVGVLLSKMFHEKNNAVIRDILPPLPEKNAKILHERIGKVLSQVELCEEKFATR
ncbi:extracellular serine/threonine protein kinase four-jointed [Phthorimaea operculella]|nr:extracellular serine/threonine protein kinase four-jointed [Phthorimaea operculella]